MELRCPSTVSASSASGSSWWVSHPDWVTSTCGRNDRSTSARRRGTPVPAGIVRVRGQRDVDALPPPRRPGRSRPGTPCRGTASRRLVDADGQHPRVAVEGGLTPSPWCTSTSTYATRSAPSSQQPRDGDRRVVEDAEPGRPRPHRVMQAARDVHRMLAVAGPDPFRRQDAAAGDESGRLVHCGKTGLSVDSNPCPTPHGCVGATRTTSRYSGSCTSVSRSSPGRLRRRRRDRRPVQHPELPGERHGQREADRVQRMLGTQVVGQELVVPDDGYRVAHAPTLSSPSRVRLTTKRNVTLVVGVACIVRVHP